MKKTLIKSDYIKNKENQKPNYNKYALPIFALVAINLLGALTLSLNTANKTSKSNSNGYVANQIAVVNNQENSVSLFLQAYENLQNSNQVSNYSTGKIKTIGTQTVNITRLYDGKTHYSQNITTGIKNSASRIYYTNDYVVTSVKGTNITPTSATWNGKVTNYTLAQYKEKFYLGPDMYLPYE